MKQFIKNHFILITFVLIISVFLVMILFSKFIRDKIAITYFNNSPEVMWMAISAVIVLLATLVPIIDDYDLKRIKNNTIKEMLSLELKENLLKVLEQQAEVTFSHSCFKDFRAIFAEAKPNTKDLYFQFLELYNKFEYAENNALLLNDKDRLYAFKFNIKIEIIQQYVYPFRNQDLYGRIYHEIERYKRDYSDLRNTTEQIDLATTTLKSIISSLDTDTIDILINKYHVYIKEMVKFN